MTAPSQNPSHIFFRKQWTDEQQTVAGDTSSTGDAGTRVAL